MRVAPSAVMKRVVILAGVVVIEIVMAIVLVSSTDHARIETTDFLNFYVGATIVREGHGRTLYQAETQQLALKSILGRRVAEYYLHPPFEAAALVPLTYLRIERAFVIWTLINSALVGLLPLLFSGCISFVSRRPYLGLLGFAFPPVLASLTLGQDSILLLFVSRKYRLIGGFVAGCAILAFVSVLITGVPGIIEYVGFVRQVDLHNGYGNVNPASMMNWRGLLAGFGWQDHQRLYAAIGSFMLIALGIFFASRWIRGANQELGFSLFVAIALAASPYNYFQDAAILLLPIFLVVDLIARNQVNGIRAKLLGLCCGLLFVWPAVLLIVGVH